LHSGLIFTQQAATPHRDLTIYTWRRSISKREPPNELIVFLDTNKYKLSWGSLWRWYFSCTTCNTPTD